MAGDWDALSTLFEGALAHSKEERAAFLDQHTNGDAALRREVESLLAAHEVAGAFLSAPALGPRAEPPGDREPARRAAGSTRLAAGTSLGVFTILEPLGAGGMGEVYRARDTRLDRLVAIKVLSSERNTAPGARERFEREARAISRLSHPRICTIHDVGVAALDGADVPYLVMELLDGETLAARIARGPLTIEQSLGYAVDIADALVAAHSQGIVHRDLKPANVMLTSTGVKLLDFGLAQLRTADGGNAQTAGVSSFQDLTSAGLVFGTLPYMSPEQLRGEKADTRTDIFAFGSVLYEMLTGERPFAADSQAGLIAAILEHDAPPVCDRQPVAAATLDRVVEKCLAKNPDERWQTARDLKSELVWVREGRGTTPRAPLPAEPPRRAGWWRLAALTGIPAVAALLLTAMSWLRVESSGAPPVAPVPARTVTRLSFNFPPGVTLDIPINGNAFAIAPDGSRIAFTGASAAGRALFVHTLATGRTIRVSNTEQAVGPIFSPDSQWLAFADANAVRKIPAGGGPSQLVVDGVVRQMTWLSDGRILTSAGIRPLREVSPQSRTVTRLADGEQGHQTPVALADGSLLLTILRGGYQSTLNSIGVLPAGASQPRDVVTNATSPQLVGPGAIVFAQGRALVGARFDTEAIRATSETVALGVEVQTTLYSAAPMYAVARNGTLVYAEPAAARRLIWVDRQGREELVKADERMYSHLRLSPDGRRIATYVADGDRDLWILGVDGSLVLKLTSGPGRDVMPVWSADGSTIFYTTAERSIMSIPSDRSRLPEPVFKLAPPQRIHPTELARDGSRLVAFVDVLPEGINLQAVELGPPARLTPLIGDSRTEGNARLSPDGKWMVYESGETTTSMRQPQIVVRRLDDIRAEQWVVSTVAGAQPIWSRDGGEIFYRAGDGTIMSVPVRTTPRFWHGSPVPLIKPPLTLTSEPGTGLSYDVSLDGRRFLLIRAPELDIRSLTVVLNWDVEVEAAIGGNR
jgi:serine/threonine protein kinase/Tol biopolymer transport system component